MFVVEKLAILYNKINKNEEEEITLQPKVDYKKIGQRIKKARMERGMSQSDLGELLECSNNHVSHVEVGQTKVSLAMLMKLSVILDKDFNYFLFDTPYTRKEHIINDEISEKLNQCSPTTLVSISKIIDILLEQEKMQVSEYLEE